MDNPGAYAPGYMRRRVRRRSGKVTQQFQENVISRQASSLAVRNQEEEDRETDLLAKMVHPLNLNTFFFNPNPEYL